jgi:hypothetical protein
MPYATRFLAVLTLGALLLMALVWSGLHMDGGRHQERLVLQKQLVTRLGLTDLCLFTEAPYTRHLSLATTALPFQDHPLAAAHFPTGSLVSPPARFFTAAGENTP